MGGGLGMRDGYRGDRDGYRAPAPAAYDRGYGGGGGGGGYERERGGGGYGGPMYDSAPAYRGGGGGGYRDYGAGAGGGGGYRGDPRDARGPPPRYRLGDWGAVAVGYMGSVGSKDVVDVDSLGAVAVGSVTRGCLLGLGGFFGVGVLVGV
jgi:hypothetical protein